MSDNDIASLWRAGIYSTAIFLIAVVIGGVQCEHEQAVVKKACVSSGRPTAECGTLYRHN